MECFGDHLDVAVFGGESSGPVEIVGAAYFHVPGVGRGFRRDVDSPESLAAAYRRGNSLHHVSLEGVRDFISNELDSHIGMKCTPGSGPVVH
jgi:hypothetical protein